MEKKYQIFISSTYEDLKEERRKVQDTILSMYHFPIGMEMFSAADEEQWEIIQETIDSSDYYVLIIGYRYGSVIEKGKDKGISYTQKEFRYAVSQKIPVLAFLVDEKNVAVTPDKIEQDSSLKVSLEKFKQEVMKGRTVEWWKSEEDLSNKVMNALNKQINRGKRPGWIREDVLKIEEMQNEIVELNKEIRKLREENSELKKSIVIRKPDLALTINDSTEIQIPFIEDNSNTIDCDYMELTMEIVPYEARRSITQSMLDEYNSKLPSKEIIEKYKEKMRFYKQAVNHPFNIYLTIHNEGNLKANDILIEMICPPEIVLYEKDTEFSIPESPKKGINPIDKFCRDRIKAPTIEINHVFPGMSGLLGSSYIRQMDAPNKHYYNDDNSLSIRMKKLMTGYTWTIKNEYILVPKEKGLFEIECHFICDEYGEKDVRIIKVVVD